MKNQQMIDSDICEVNDKDSLLLSEIINLLKINNSKKHLTESEYMSILRLYSYYKHDNRGGLPIYCHISTYQKTIETFPTLELWENALYHEKIISVKNKGTNFLYYCVLIMCKRLRLDWNIFKGFSFNLPKMMSEYEKNNFFKAAEGLRLSRGEAYCAYRVINKILLATGKTFSNIKESDIYEYRDNNNSRKGVKGAFNILRYLNILSSESTYINEYNYTNKKEADLGRFGNIYRGWVEYVGCHFPPSQIFNYTYPAKLFLLWLKENEQPLRKIYMLRFEHIEEFSKWLKLSTSPVTGDYLTKSTITNKLSNLKKFLYYLGDENLITQEFKNTIHHISKLYYNIPKGANFPKPVPKEDIIKIEKALATFEWPSHPIVPKILNLLYYLAPRPSEALTLSLDCLKGSKETPFLHIHRTKFYKERWVPLAPVELSLIEEMYEYNKHSIPIYHEFDNRTIKRLFNYKGEIVSDTTLNTAFRKLQIDNGIVTNTGEPKYTIYILRKIRITVWLEAGISKHDVAYLVGHGNVDSHNFYLVGKESRIANAQKAYNQWYKDMIEQIAEKGFFEEIPEITKEKEYIEKLKEMLLQIETKNINSAIYESLTQNVPELISPVPCGKCFAIYVFGLEYECEKIKFPCLECSELELSDNSINYFDNYTQRVFISKKERIKAGLDGLVTRDEALLSRLKQFYTLKFGFSPKDVELHFSEIESRCVSKRGRPPKKQK